MLCSICVLDIIAGCEFLHFMFFVFTVDPGLEKF